jgi:hypothetical protein
MVHSFLKSKGKRKGNGNGKRNGKTVPMQAMYA